MGKVVEVDFGGELKLGDEIEIPGLFRYVESYRAWRRTCMKYAIVTALWFAGCIIVGAVAGYCLAWY